MPKVVHRKLNKHTLLQQPGITRCHHHDQLSHVQKNTSFLTHLWLNLLYVCIHVCVSSQCEFESSSSQMHSNPQLSQQGTGGGYCGELLGKQKFGVIVFGIRNAIPLVAPTTGNADFSSSWVCFQQLLEQSAWLNNIPNAAVLINSD